MRSVDIFVASLAQGDAIGDLKAQFRVLLPRLDVVCLNLAFCAALLACVAVASVYSLPPQAIFIGVAPLVGLGSARGQMLAFERAVFFLGVTIERLKLDAAAQACERLAGATLPGKFGRTGAGTGGDYFAGAEIALKRLAADHTGSFSAFKAEALASIGGLKRAAAQVADLVLGNYGPPVSLAVGVAQAELGAAIDLGGAAWMGTKFARCHRSNVARIGGFP